MICIYCRSLIAPADKVLQVYRYVGERYGVPLAAGDPEPAHVRCGDPARVWSHQNVPPQALKRYNPGMTPRVAPSHQCLYCGEVLRRNDRIVEIIRVQGVDHDPVRGVPGIVCDDDREYAHGRCEDRDATKGPNHGLVVLR